MGPRRLGRRRRGAGRGEAAQRAPAHGRLRPAGAPLPVAVAPRRRRRGARGGAPAAPLRARAGRGAAPAEEVAWAQYKKYTYSVTS